MQTASGSPQRIAIAGASGLLGRAVSARLDRDGHFITRLVRSREAARAPDAVFWDPATGDIDREALAGHDVLINLSGENPAGFWTEPKKRRMYDSRVDGTALLARTIAELPAERRPHTFLVASASGYYGDRPPESPVDESDPPGTTFMAKLVRDWEAAADPARAAGVRVLHTRFGAVLDPETLLYKLLTTATRLGLGARLGDGTQVFPWVTRDEIAQVVPFLLRHEGIEGPVNVVAPDRVTNADVGDTLARVMGRPRFLRVPAPALRLAGELGRELLRGAWIVSGKLQESDYVWRDPHLESALRSMLTRRAGRDA